MPGSAAQILVQLATLVLGGGGLWKFLTWITGSLAERAKERREGFAELLDRYKAQIDELEGEAVALRRRCTQAEMWAAQLEGAIFRQGLTPPPRPGGGS